MFRTALYELVCAMVWRVCWSRLLAWSPRARWLGTSMWNAGQRAKVRWMIRECRKSGWNGYGLWEQTGSGMVWTVRAQEEPPF